MVPGDFSWFGGLMVYIYIHTNTLQENKYTPDIPIQRFFFLKVMGLPNSGIWIRSMEVQKNIHDSNFNREIKVKEVPSSLRKDFRPMAKLWKFLKAKALIG